MNELTKRQIRAAQLEASGMMAKDIADELNVTPQTISSYRRLDEYRVLVSKIAQASLKAAQLKLIESSSQAVDTIICMMVGGDDATKLKAAELILKLVGINEARHSIGTTNYARLRVSELHQSQDYILGKEIHGKTDDYLNDISGV